MVSVVSIKHRLSEMQDKVGNLAKILNEKNSELENSRLLNNQVTFFW